jgi:LysM repeat protein
LIVKQLIHQIHHLILINLKKVHRFNHATFIGFFTIKFTYQFMKHFIILGFFSLINTAVFAQNCPPSTVKNVHIVQKGETLYSLSRQYKTTVATLCQLNNIQESDILKVCSALDVVNPVAAKSVPSVASKSVNPVPTSYNTVTVKSKGMPYFRSNKRTHIVKKQETLDMIAEYYGYTRARLMYMNNIKNAKDLKVGQELVVNDCNATTTATYDDAATDVPQSYSVVSKSATAKNSAAASNAISETNYATTNFSSTNYTSNDYAINNLYTTATHGGDMVVNANYSWNPNYHRVIHIVTQDNMSQKETLASVGQLHGLSAAEVAAMNGLSSNAALTSGQKLIVEERLEHLEASSDGFMSSGSMPVSHSGGTPQYTTSLTDVAPPNYNTTSYMNAASTPVVNNTTMTPDEMKMVEEINAIRRNPAGYIVQVEQYIKTLEKQGNNQSAISAARELITELFGTPVLTTLQPMECIYSAGKKYGIEQRKRGAAEHQGLDGSMPWDRIMKACPSLKDGNENLVGGPADIRESVMLLLVDDGIDSRGHRRTILQPNWKYIACHKMGQVGAMPNYWVQQFGN